MQYPRVEISLQAAQRLSGEDVEFDGDQRTRLRIGQPVRGDDAADTVGQVPARGPDRGDLAVLAEPVGHLAVAAGDFGFDDAEVQRGDAGDGVHLGHQLTQGVCGDEVNALVDERVHGRRPFAAAFQDSLDAAAGQVRILFLARQPELLGDDAGVQHEPRVVLAGLRDVLQGAEGVKSRIQRDGQTLAVGIEPQRGRSRQNANPVMRPDRIVVGDALDVVPHPVLVDHAGACGLGDLQHPAVHVRWHAAEQLLGHPPHPLGPVLADELMVAPDPAAGDDDRLGAELELAQRIPRRRRASDLR